MKQISVVLMHNGMSLDQRLYSKDQSNVIFSITFH